ncbi:hypothetical protein BHM03_00059980 [Ensete ventricosum]|nr:hypothetical protein BHM03_00059980 [Ensete ventricosum]
MHWVDAVENSLEVHQELAEGIGSLLGWHKGVRQKKTETRQKIIGVNRSYPGVRVAEPPRSAGKLPVNHPYPDVRAAEPRRSAGKPPVPSFFGMFDFLLQFRKPLEGLVFTQGRSVVDAGVPQEEGVGSGRRPLVSNH